MLRTKIKIMSSMSEIIRIVVFLLLKVVVAHDVGNV